ncbi:MAG: sigma-70 family RNA polymerase sigma factor [Polyangiaceae bacterium]|nr:sigma-70 family RNA polymerase sigma factor [Myxococcales bacterium]MCB9588312.1 sigma-70 family RNA polymerase sigma factor [Polyangiaceae bacterium]
MSEASAAQAPLDNARLQQLFTRHYAWVWRTVRRLGVAESAVDDVVQQVYITVNRQLDRIRPEAERAYLFGVAQRLAANARRGARRNRGTASDELDLEPASGRNPEQLVDFKERRQQLDRWLDQLDDDLRAPFVLFELEGLSLAEIADTLDLPLGTVKTRLRRARERFLEVAQMKQQEATHG